MQYPVTIPRVLAYVSARYFLSSRAEDIYGETGFVWDQADLIEVADRAIGVFVVARPVADIRIRNDLTFAVFAVEKSRFTSRTYMLDHVVQLLQFGSFWFRVTGNMLVDLIVYLHENPLMRLL